MRAAKLAQRQQDNKSDPGVLAFSPAPRNGKHQSVLRPGLWQRQRCKRDRHTPRQQLSRGQARNVDQYRTAPLRMHGQTVPGTPPASDWSVQIHVSNMLTTPPAYAPRWCTCSAPLQTCSSWRGAPNPPARHGQHCRHRYRPLPPRPLPQPLPPLVPQLLPPCHVSPVAG